MPMQPGLYPPDWKAISQAIRFRSGGQCECTGECGLHLGKRCIEMNGQAALYAKGKVVLTVAHLNGESMDCRDENLKAMCQRCHLRIDIELHKRHAAKHRRQKKIVSGQLEMEVGDE